MAAFRELLDADFHEQVAREHVEGGMSVVELHRNHGVPLSAVRKWIETYRNGGHEAIHAAAAELAAVQRKAPTPAVLKALRATLASSEGDVRSRQKRIDAVITIGVRRVHALADEIERLVGERDTTIEALLTLGDLGEIERIDRVAASVGDSYRGWVEGARERAVRVHEETG